MYIYRHVGRNGGRAHWVEHSHQRVFECDGSSSIIDHRDDNDDSLWLIAVTILVVVVSCCSSRPL